MDPGVREACVGVYYRTETTDARGGVVVPAIEKLGDYWAMFISITKSFSYSGFETAQKVDGDVPLPVVRLTFEMDTPFEYKRLEFHVESEDGQVQIFIPRNPALRTPGIRGSKISYNCSHYTPRNS